MSASGDVRVEYCRPCGSLLRTVNAKEAKLDVTVSDRDVPQLSLAVKGKELLFPLTGEVQIHARHINEGKLTARLPEANVQILVSGANRQELQSIIEAIAFCRRQSLSPNIVPKKKTKGGSTPSKTQPPHVLLRSPVPSRCLPAFGSSSRCAALLQHSPEEPLPRKAFSTWAAVEEPIATTSTKPVSKPQKIAAALGKENRPSSAAASATSLGAAARGLSGGQNLHPAQRPLSAAAAARTSGGASRTCAGVSSGSDSAQATVQGKGPAHSYFYSASRSVGNSSGTTRAPTSVTAHASRHRDNLLSSRHNDDEEEEGDNDRDDDNASNVQNPHLSSGHPSGGLSRVQLSSKVKIYLPPKRLREPNGESSAHEVSTASYGSTRASQPAHGQGSGGGQGPSSSLRVPAEVELSEQQARVLGMVRAGGNVFFTGSAGTGKSFLLQQIIAMLPAATTSITASTGLAACSLNGTTLNRFAGVGRADGSPQQLLEMARKKATADRWRAVRTLIVDEVSMVDAELLDSLDFIARSLRNSSKPFGGIQLIFAGDFHQLPPVSQGSSMHGTQSRRFCFQANCWWTLFPKQCCVQLTQVYRQADVGFIQLLNAIRTGEASVESVHKMLHSADAGCEVTDHPEDGILPTKLHTHKLDVDGMNKRMIDELDGETKTYTAEDDYAAGAAPTHPQGSILEACCPARAKLELKLGAQVMLVKTISVSDKLVNGARGVVTKFTPHGQLPVVRFTSGMECTIQRETWRVSMGGRVVASRRQLPLDLAWALSIHKSQGMSLDRVEVSLERVFECGQAYVALSRARTLQGLKLVGKLNATALRAHPQVVEFYKSIESGIE
eukprot:jgi/Mesvir1/7352/Mv25801-RA.1